MKATLTPAEIRVLKPILESELEGVIEYSGCGCTKALAAEYKTVHALAARLGCEVDEFPMSLETAYPPAVIRRNSHRLAFFASKAGKD